MPDTNRELTKQELDHLTAETRLIEAQAKEQEDTNTLRDNDMRSHTVYPFFNPVTDTTVYKAIHDLEARSRAHPGEEIVVLLNCPGGSVLDGMALFDYLRDLSVRGHKVTIKVIGCAASMAAILAQAGDERVMTRNSYMMIHEASTVIEGSRSQTEAKQKLLARLDDHGTDILLSRSNLTKIKLRNRIKKGDLWLNAEEALAEGLIDRIEG